MSFNLLEKILLTGSILTAAVSTAAMVIYPEQKDMALWGYCASGILFGSMVLSKGRKVINELYTSREN
jgi:hypothetical protein